LAKSTSACVTAPAECVVTVTVTLRVVVSRIASGWWLEALDGGGQVLHEPRDLGEVGEQVAADDGLALVLPASQPRQLGGQVFGR